MKVIIHLQMLYRWTYKTFWYTLIVKMFAFSVHIRMKC